MHDIVMLSATLHMADRFKEVTSFKNFLDMFKEEQHETIESILFDFGYIEYYWPEVTYMYWNGEPAFRWT